MKEDKEKFLDSCEIENSVTEADDSHNHQKEEENDIVTSILVNSQELKNPVTEIPTVVPKENSFNGDNTEFTEADINESEKNETIKVDTNQCTSFNECRPKPSENNDLCETKLILRPRKAELFQNGDEDYKIVKLKNGCRKTENKSAIKQNDNLPVDAPPIVSPINVALELNPGLSSAIKQDLYNYVKHESAEGISADSTPISVIIPKTEGECINNSTFIESRESNESEMKETSGSSDNSIIKIPKKRRRKRETWYTKKKKKSEGNNQKNHSNLVLVQQGSFQLRDMNVGINSHDNSEKKTKEFAIPSPSLADINIKAAIPEPTATSAKVSKPNICLCQKKPSVFISGNNNSTDLYCQALDCIDNRIVGCCNAIPSQDVGLYRASEKAAFQMMCSVHQERLLRHNCCPGCGLFCTQGKYMMCKSWHHFHRLCFIDNNKNNVVRCPHCGDTQLKAVTVSIHASKDPVFLPLQKPIRNMKSAKMSLVRGNMQLIEEEETPVFSFPESLLNLDGDGSSSQNGFTQVIQKDKLAHLLNIACRSFSKICCNNRYSYKSLYSAAQNGEIEKLLKAIASGLNPNHIFEENNNQTALHVAAGNGHLSAVHILLQAKAQLNVFDGEQNTPLTAAISAKHNDVVKYLIKCGADLLLKGEDGMTPLHIAAKCGNVGACYHLLNGTHLPTRYIDSLDDGGWTPMVWASEFNHLDVVRFLIGKGADSLIKDAEQNIALHWAAFGGSVDIVEMFLNDGSDINAVNVHGDTPLHIAARQHKYSCVLLLLARGARSDLKNKNGEQPRDCSDSTSDIYKGITLNMEISALLTRFLDRSPKIVSNDISRGKERNQIQCVNGVDDESEPGDFVYVSESCFTSKISVDRTITSLQSCKCQDVCSSDNCTCGSISTKCWYDNDGRLKSDFNYVDPPPIFECNQACQCNKITCRNRVVQNGLTCRFQLFKTEERGWGIRTLNLILKGTFVCEYVGEIISDWEADHREDDSYLFDLENRDGETYCIDARYYGNIARFINHMCVPNVIPVHIFVDHQDLRFPRIAFFANRDILPNEELGYNYGDKFWVIKWKSFTCVCGSEKCLYSESTIQTTLDNYQKKLSEENS